MLARPWGGDWAPFVQLNARDTRQTFGPVDAAGGNVRALQALPAVVSGSEDFSNRRWFFGPGCN